MIVLMSNEVQYLSGWQDRGLQDRDLSGWQDRAMCLDVDSGLFFAGRGISTRKAKKVCRNCPVRVQCLDYALSNGEQQGVWGGMSARERRRVRSS